MGIAWSWTSPSRPHRPLRRRRSQPLIHAAPWRGTTAAPRCSVANANCPPPSTAASLPRWSCSRASRNWKNCRPGSKRVCAARSPPPPRPQPRKQASPRQSRPRRCRRLRQKCRPLRPRRPMTSISSPGSASRPCSWRHCCCDAGATTTRSATVAGRARAREWHNRPCARPSARRQPPRSGIRPWPMK